MFSLQMSYLSDDRNGEVTDYNRVVWCILDTISGKEIAKN